MRWHDRRGGSFSGSASPLVQASSARSRRTWNPEQQIREITRKAKGVSIKTTMEELATYMRAGAAISALRNARVLIALTPGPIATAGRSVAPMENPPPPLTNVSEWAARNRPDPLYLTHNSPTGSQSYSNHSSAILFQSVSATRPLTTPLCGEARLDPPIPSIPPPQHQNLQISSFAD